MLGTSHDQGNLTLKRRFEYYNLTSRFSLFIILLANQSVVLQQIELVARSHFFVAEKATKTFQVVNVVLGASYDLGGWNTVTTCGAFGSETPEVK